MDNTALPLATYTIKISPKYIIANANNSAKQALLDAKGTITLGVMSNDSTSVLSPTSPAQLSDGVKAIEGGFAVTWTLDKTKLTDMKTMEVIFTFKEKMSTGNISWNVFSLDYAPTDGGVAISNKYLPMVYIKSCGQLQTNLNNSASDDFILSGPGDASTGIISVTTDLGPSGAGLSSSENKFQVFDTLQKQPVYLVQQPVILPFPIPQPNNFIFRGDRPLGLYAPGGTPVNIKPDQKANRKDVEKCADNQFIDFKNIHKFMKERFNEQGTYGTFPTKINFIDVSITALNQQYTDIPTTDLPYQELRSFNKANYPKQTSQADYEAILNTANLNNTIPSTADIPTFTDDDGNEITFTSKSKFCWVHLSTTKAKPFVNGLTQQQYAQALQTEYSLNADDYYNFINDIIHYLVNTEVDSSNIVFIHCNAGTMRTGAFVTCLLLTQYPDISLEKAAYYGKSLFANDGDTVYTVVNIHDYWELVQNYCAYLDLKTNNPNPRVASTVQPIDIPFNTPGSPYHKYPNPWQWKQQPGS